MDFASWTCWLKNQFWRLTVVKMGSVSNKQPNKQATKQNKTKRSETKQNKRQQDKTNTIKQDRQTNKQTNKQPSKTKRNEAKRNKTKENKTNTIKQDRQTNKQTNKQASKQTTKQTTKQTHIFNQDRPASLFESIIRLIIFSCFVFVFQLELQQRNPPDQVVVAIHVAFHLTFPQNIGNFDARAFKNLVNREEERKECVA